MLNQEMNMLALQYRGDPRNQARPMRPMMHDMAMKGMPPDMAAFMEPMMRPGAQHGPGEDVGAWDAAYADASGRQGDAEMFEMFERAYGRPAPRSGQHMHPPPSRAVEGHQRQRQNWAEDFDQENKFAEFEAIYRTFFLLSMNICISQSVPHTHVARFPPRHVYGNMQPPLTKIAFRDGLDISDFFYLLHLFDQFVR